MGGGGREKPLNYKSARAVEIPASGTQDERPRLELSCLTAVLAQWTLEFDEKCGRNLFVTFKKARENERLVAFRPSSVAGTTCPPPYITPPTSH